MNTKLIRLQSGEDIICDIINESDTEVTFQRPIVAVPQQQNQIGFAPWSPLAKEEQVYDVPKSFVVYIIEANENITEQYEALFATVITPQKKLIL